MLNRHISISLRLTMWFGSTFFLGCLLFGTDMWLNLKHTLTAERRQTLDRRLDRLQDLLRANGAERVSDRTQDFKEFAHATGNGLAEVFHTNGQRAYSSPSNSASNFPWPKVRQEEEEVFAPVDFGGQPYWVLSRPFTLDSEHLVLLAAAPGAGNVAILGSFWRTLLESIPVLLLISSAGGYWISRRALRPVDHITTSARSISIGNLSERLPVTNSGDELQRLAETCNDMLERLESAVKRLKQFTADASHELRGPLQLTRTVAEVALRNPNADERSRDAFQDIVEESVMAADLLDQMLVLARADAEQFAVEMTPVNLVAITLDAFGMASKIASENGLTISIAYPQHEAVEVMGNSSSLRRMIWIVLDNALKYTAAPGEINVTLSVDGDRATACISDTGAGIAEANLPYIFDRFYRADPSRSQVAGSGLGLSIARWIADMHHIEILVSTKTSVGTTFTMNFPTRVL